MGRPLANRVAGMVLEGKDLDQPAAIDAKRLSSNLSDTEKEVLDAHFDSLILGWALSLASGNASKLFHDVGVALSSDLIPCGWMGDFPSGRLIVYIPKIVQISTES